MAHRWFTREQLLGFLLEIITLRSARGRLTAFLSATVAIYFTPYFILAHLSLWKLIGFHSAPSIGLTRAYWQLLHFNLDAAWQRNPLIFLVLAIGLSLLALDLLTLYKNRLTARLNVSGRRRVLGDY